MKIDRKRHPIKDNIGVMFGMAILSMIVGVVVDSSLGNSWPFWIPITLIMAIIGLWVLVVSELIRNP